MTRPRKRRSRTRRTFTPTSRPTLLAGGSPSTRLGRAATAATALGLLAIATMLAARYHLLPWQLGTTATVYLQVSGIGLLLAGLVLRHTTR